MSVSCTKCGRVVSKEELALGALMMVVCPCGGSLHGPNKPMKPTIQELIETCRVCSHEKVIRLLTALDKLSPHLKGWDGADSNLWFSYYHDFARAVANEVEL